MEQLPTLPQLTRLEGRSALLLNAVQHAQPFGVSSTQRSTWVVCSCSPTTSWFSLAKFRKIVPSGFDATAERMADSGEVQGICHDLKWHFYIDVPTAAHVTLFLALFRELGEKRATLNVPFAARWSDIIEAMRVNPSTHINTWLVNPYNVQPI